MQQEIDNINIYIRITIKNNQAKWINAINKQMRI